MKHIVKWEDQGSAGVKCGDHPQTVYVEAGEPKVCPHCGYTLELTRVIRLAETPPGSWEERAAILP